MRSDLEIRPAAREDADALARFFDMASDGMPRKVWAKLAAPGQSIWEVAADRVRRDDALFSFRNAWVVECHAAVVAAAFGYVLPAAPAEPTPDDDPMWLPFQELQNLACGSWYLDALAVVPEHRGHGLGSKLLDYIEGVARSAGCSELSLVVMSGNEAAFRLYERLGYSERARRRFIAEGWPNHDTDGILLFRDLRLTAPLQLSR